MLLAYMDPSGTHIGSPMISIAGFVAEESNWQLLASKWNAVLSKISWPSKLTRFHMFDCVHCEGEFFEGRWRFAERLALYGELVEVIRNCDLRPLGASVVTDAFASLPSEDLELLQREQNSLGTPLDVVFHMITQQILKCVTEFNPNETVGVLFDQDDSKREEYFSDFAIRYMTHSHLGDNFSAFGFGDSRIVSPLQAADLLAYGTHHLTQFIARIPTYSSPDFPVMPAFWSMLVDLAAQRHTSPNGQMINAQGLKDLVQKVKNKELLPKKTKRV